MDFASAKKNYIEFTRIPFRNEFLMTETTYSVEKWFLGK
jgi:hypothetical protein